VATVAQTHKEFSGRGQLIRGVGPPIDVRYYIVLSARPIITQALAGPYETQWEWDKAQGFLTLIYEENALEVEAEVCTQYTLVLEDGTRCAPTLTHDNNRPRMKYRVQCSAMDLLGYARSALASGKSALCPVYDTPHHRQ
jgi:hypothetical protein